jgi:hypothetical protein
VIEGAASELEGIGAEYGWLSGRFGEQGRDWRLVTQSLIMGNTIFDRMEIVTAAGETRTIYFDITGFYGRMDDLLG